MNRQEEIKKYEHKIGELHSRVEQEARELSKIESLKQQALQDRERAKKEKESLGEEISALKIELERMNEALHAKYEQEELFTSRQGVRRNKLLKDIEVLKGKLSQASSQVQKRKALVKDLSRLEKKQAKTLALYKKTFSSLELARKEHTAIQKQAKKTALASARILIRTEKKEAEYQARENAIGNARKKVLFYTKRINEWNKSRNLKPLDIQL